MHVQHVLSTIQAPGRWSACSGADKSFSYAFRYWLGNGVGPARQQSHMINFPGFRSFPARIFPRRMTCRRPVQGLGDGFTWLRTAGHRPLDPPGYSFTAIFSRGWKSPAWRNIDWRVFPTTPEPPPSDPPISLGLPSLPSAISFISIPPMPYASIPKTFPSLDAKLMNCFSSVEDYRPHGLVSH